MVADAILEPLSEDYESENNLAPVAKAKRTKFPKLDKLVELQRDAEKRILGGCPNKDAASLMRAWKELELLRRIMLNRPIQVLPSIPKPSRYKSLRRFGLVRSVDAQIVDVGPAEKPAEKPEPAPPPVSQKPGTIGIISNRLSPLS